MQRHLAQLFRAIGLTAMIVGCGLGVNITIPLRILDRNQGEKERTLLDITRNQRPRDATDYLQRATQVRDTVLFSSQHGRASLLDFIQAQQYYRRVQVNYLNLVSSYLSAAAQMNLAV